MLGWGVTTRLASSPAIWGGGGGGGEWPGMYLSIRPNILVFCS